MKIVYEYWFGNGEEILKKNYAGLYNEIITAIELAETPRRMKINGTRERIQLELIKESDDVVYSGIDMNREIEKQFIRFGWKHENRDYKYKIRLPNYPHTIATDKEIDFLKNRVGVEVQFGKYPFVEFDFLKFAYLYVNGKIDVGVQIVPCHLLHKQMSKGTPYGEEFIDVLEKLKGMIRGFPILILLIDIPTEIDKYNLHEREALHGAYHDDSSSRKNASKSSLEYFVKRS